jgi:hypothetical protein
MASERKARARVDFVTLLLILSVSIVIAHGYFYRIDLPNYEPRLEIHNQIIAGTAPARYDYRILVPFTCEILTKVFSFVLSLRRAFLLSYAIYDLLSIFFLLFSLFMFLKTWFTRDQALVGVLFVAGTIPIAFQYAYFQPFSLLEAGLFSAALLAICRKYYRALVILVVLASLNRETGIFIPLGFLLAGMDVKSLLKAGRIVDWKPILISAGLFFVWAVIFFGLRYFRGSASPSVTVDLIFAHNTSWPNVFIAFVNGAIFLGGFWVFAALGFKYAPPFIKRVSLLVPLYLITILIWGAWYEVRLLMTLYPILISLGLSFIYRKELKAYPA